MNKNRESEDDCSILKTVIAFNKGTILRSMGNRTAAANAMACFELFPVVRRKSMKEPINPAISASGAYDVMMHYALDSEKKGYEDRVTDYIESLTGSEVREINSAFTAMAEMLIEHNEIPVVGGREAVQRIYTAILKETLH